MRITFTPQNYFFDYSKEALTNKELEKILDECSLTEKNSNEIIY